MEIRLVLNKKCNLRCTFCHNEGVSDCDKYKFNNLEIIDSLNKLRIANPKFDSVHITGGEPTLYKNLNNLIKELNNNSWKLKITTNGGFNLKLVDWSIFKNVNISVHAINWEDLKSFQKGLDEHYCKKFCNLQKENISILLKDKVDVKINTIYISTRVLKSVLSYFYDKKITHRILTDLRYPERSFRLIKKVLQDNYVLTQINDYKDSSNVEYLYKDIFGKEIIIKSLTKRYLNSLCTKCPKRNTGDCLEGFYDIRLVKDINGSVVIKPCLSNQRQYSIEEFVQSNLLKEIKRL